MTIAYLDYPLSHGYIHNWLVAGPHAEPVTDLARYTGPEYRLRIAEDRYDPASRVTEPPAEMQALTVGDTTLDWKYVRCKDDHFVDLSVFHHECTYLAAWAYAEVVSAGEQRVACVLTTNGPADVWLGATPPDGVHVHRHAHFYHQRPNCVPFELTLQPGPNAILVRFEQVAARECPYVMALQLVAADGAADRAALSVRLPTAIAPVERRRAFEAAFYAASLRQDVFAGNDEATVCWPEDYAERLKLTVRVQTPGRDIHAEGQKAVGPGARAGMGAAYAYPEGEYDLLLMPTPREYYLGNMRITRALRCSLARGRFSETPYGDLAGRSLEALQDAAQRGGSVFSEIAKMALAAWGRVRPPVILDALARINRRGDCSDFDLVGLLGMAYRYAEDPAFPAELRQPLEDCILGFKYWQDEPGSDAMCYTTENHSILFHTCEVLAGQLYPDRVFTNTGETGRQHRAKGEQRASAWLAERAAYGFKEWDSNCYFEEDVLALSHLLSLVEDDDLASLATVVLDKLLFTLALNSYRGVFGSTHGRTYTPHIKSAYNEATSGMSRLLWGMGVFNRHILATVSLACSGYTFPDVIRDIATDLPDELWSREQHTGSPVEWLYSGSLPGGVNKVTYKTPDTMLCSAQDWHAGQPGYQQHIWQATLGPQAPVFVTHPACASEDGSHRPNFWHGNAVLPRVCQWKDVLIAVHNLPEDDWMGFTHAFFPAAAFDEFECGGSVGCGSVGDGPQHDGPQHEDLVSYGRSPTEPAWDGWAFARRGDGYLALTASRGLTWMTSGDNAYRELRSYGLHNVWVCHMGRRVLDGDFADFKARIRSLSVEFDDLAVRLRSLRGDELAFGWEGPLRLNGAEQAITGFKHYDSPYCTVELGAEVMDIGHGDALLRLRLG